MLRSYQITTPPLYISVDYVEPFLIVHFFPYCTVFSLSLEHLFKLQVSLFLILTMVSQP